MLFNQHIVAVYSMSLWLCSDCMTFSNSYSFFYGQRTFSKSIKTKTVYAMSEIYSYGNLIFLKRNLYCSKFFTDQITPETPLLIWCEAQPSYFFLCPWIPQTLLFREFSVEETVKCRLELCLLSKAGAALAQSHVSLETTLPKVWIMAS